MVISEWVLDVKMDVKPLWLSPSDGFDLAGMRAKDCQNRDGKTADWRRIKPWF